MSKLIRTAAAVAAAVAGVTLSACSGLGGSTSGGDIVSVNGTKIARADLDHRLESSPMAKQVLTQLVQQALIDQYAKDQNITIAQTDVDKSEADIKSKYPPGQFQAILTQQGLTEADVQNILRQKLVIEKAIGPQLHVTDADVKAFFDKNHATFDQPEQVRARHILVADEKTADMIEAKLKGGAKFADLVTQYSTDTASKATGGDLGFFARGKMVPAFSDAAFALKVGQTSAPVKSPFGWHIINLEDRKPAVTATLASAHAQILDQLKQQQEQQLIPGFMQTLRSKANIQVLDPRYADVFPPPLPAPPATTPAPAKT
jgi:foldase protein PrsA